MSDDRSMQYLKERTTVDPQTGCWLWRLRLDRDGYGRCKQSGRVWFTHRLSWTVANGPIQDGLCVCHRCDVRTCCNPDHLFLGTSTENNIDRDTKGRHVQLKGSGHGNARMVEHDVSIIKMLLGLGVKQHRLAALYGVSRQAITRIKSGGGWSHVAGAAS